MRFDIRPDSDGWTIYDRDTNEPAVVFGLASVGLPYADADELVGLLSTLDLLKGRTLREPASCEGWITLPTIHSEHRGDERYDGLRRGRVLTSRVPTPPWARQLDRRSLLDDHGVQDTLVLIEPFSDDASDHRSNYRSNPE